MSRSISEQETPYQTVVPHRRVYTQQPSFGHDPSHYIPVIYETGPDSTDPMQGLTSYTHEASDWESCEWPARLLIALFMKANQDGRLSRHVRRTFGYKDIRLVVQQGVLGWTEGQKRGSKVRAIACEKSFNLTLRIDANEIEVGRLYAERYICDGRATYRISVSDVETLTSILEWCEIEHDASQLMTSNVQFRALPCSHSTNIEDCAIEIEAVKRVWHATRNFWQASQLDSMNGMSTRCFQTADLRDLGLVSPTPSIGYVVVMIEREEEAMIIAWDCEAFAYPDRIVVAATSESFLAFVLLQFPRD